MTPVEGQAIALRSMPTGTIMIRRRRAFTASPFKTTVTVLPPSSLASIKTISLKRTFWTNPQEIGHFTQSPAVAGPDAVIVPDDLSAASGETDRPAGQVADRPRPHRVWLLIELDRALLGGLGRCRKR
jgi:hypothetical protein